jgi:adenylate cyclase
MPVAWAARWHSLYVGQGWSVNRTEDATQAMALASHAIELDRQNALALGTFGHLKSFLSHDFDTALVYLERALIACPNSALAWITSSPTLAYIGRSEDAVSHAEHALVLSPFDRELYYYYAVLCLARFAHGDYDEAVKWGRMSISENPGYTANLRYLIAALIAMDRVDEARELAQELLRYEPGFRLSEWERTRQPFRDAVMREKYVGALTKAGLPR